jgi:hypothetical protein
LAASGGAAAGARDFQVTPSTDYAPAYQNGAIALRISGRFNMTVPVPGKAIRKLTVTPAGPLGLDAPRARERRAEIARTRALDAAVT